jgi:tetratricopeptide (TPR) repeat protein
VAKSTSKEIKETLKQPDEFVSFWTRTATQASEFAAARKRALVIGATMLGTVIVGSLIFSTVSEGRSKRATEQLTRIERIATAELRPEGTPTTNPDGTPIADDGAPHFKTEKERSEAALKELDAFLASGGNPLTAEGKLQRGPLLLSLGRAPEAIATYEELLKGKVDGRLRFLANEGLGYAYEAKGDLNAAAAAFAKLSEDAKEGAFYADRAAYHQARIAELRGNAADAKKLYKEVLDKNPSTSLRDEITNRLAVLETK